MKGHDLLVLIHLARSKDGADVSYRNLGEGCGISQSQAFESVERCIETGLLDRGGKQVNIPRFLSLLQHSLPYLFPVKIGAPGLGVPLALQPMVITSPSSPVAGAKLVWETGKANGAPRVHGILIEPFAKAAVDIAQNRPELLPLLSCIELLRFVDHPLKKLALSQVEWELGKVVGPASVVSTGPVEAISNEALDAGIKFLAENGFKSSRFSVLAPIMGVMEGDLRRIYGHEDKLFLILLNRGVQVAGQILGPISIKSELSKEDLVAAISEFLNYLQSNEDFHRLVLWTYLEGSRELKAQLNVSFNFMMDLMVQKISSLKVGLDRDEAVFRAYLFLTCPQWYSIFSCDEASRFKDQSVVPVLREKFQEFILQTALSRVTD